MTKQTSGLIKSAVLAAKAARREPDLQISYWKTVSELGLSKDFSQKDIRDAYEQAAVFNTSKVEFAD